MPVSHLGRPVFESQFVTHANGFLPLTWEQMWPVCSLESPIALLMSMLNSLIMKYRFKTHGDFPFICSRKFQLSLVD